jgi:hypothetical protein
MSTAGIYASIVADGDSTKHCLLIGDGVPHIHHSDGMPVYMVIESERGIPIMLKDHSIRNLLAYPSSWVGPGEYNHDHWLFAEHENLAWHALIPCFDGETT